jgi:hypothetical protein
MRKIIEYLIETALIRLNVVHSMFSAVAHNTSPKTVIILNYSIFFWGCGLLIILIWGTVCSVQVHVTFILTHHNAFETLPVLPDDDYKKIRSTYVCPMTVAQNFRMGKYMYT